MNPFKRKLTNPATPASEIKPVENEDVALAAQEAGIPVKPYPEENEAKPAATVLHERKRQVNRRLFIYGIAAFLMLALFLNYDAWGYWTLIAGLRIKRLIGLTVVAVALSVATVVFQAVTRNRILSPSVMGFDAMYRLIATALVFFLTSAVVNRIPHAAMFTLQAIMMTALAVSLFLFMLRRGQHSIHLLVLVGIVIGSFLRALTTLMTSIMDPNEFLNVQDLGMASFQTINETALTVTIIVTVVAVGYTYWKGQTWDLLSLGPDVATGLGVRYSHEVKLALTASSLLVACATALVGPLMFFGLLVVNIAIYAIGTSKLRSLVWGASFIGIIILVGGQAILEHILDHGTVLPVIIELFGGTMLLIMLVKEARK